MILVTGAAGNVGSEVVRALLDRGQQVRALTRDGQAKGLPVPAEPARGANGTLATRPVMAGD